MEKNFDCKYDMDFGQQIKNFTIWYYSEKVGGAYVCTCMSNNMFLEVGHPCEPFVAIGTGEGPFSSMYQSVRSQSLRVGKTAMTFLTHKWFLSSVRAHVSRHLAPLIKTLATFRTDIGSLPSMSSEMILVVTLCDKSLTALLTFEWLISLLTEFMVFDVGFGFELFLTNVALVHRRLPS